MRRLARLVLVALSVLVLGCASATCAVADDLPLPQLPPGVPGPSEVLGGDVGGLQAPAGPTYVVTPGSPGSALPAPQRPGATTRTDPSAVSDARKALDRLHGTRTPKKAAAGQVAAPLAPASATTAPDDHHAVWLVGAALLLLVVLVELGRAGTAWGRRIR